MAIKKIAEVASIDTRNLVSAEKVAAQMAADDVVSDRFTKMTGMLREAQAKAQGGKKVAPKVDDFLYASTVMMHAAEAALIDQNTGKPILNKKGEPVKGWFEKVKDKRGNDSVKWVSPDGVLPYRNANRDIFPEEDLVAKHKEWVGKPLCRDHVSNTVDGVRGIIVDTYYDPKFKRVHALFALDRKNYPDLARKVEAGYATSVSMGTAVGKAICSDCSNVATVEAEYCTCTRTKSSYGEVNKELSPIELSIVVTGADPLAKIKTVIASLNNYVEQKHQEFDQMAKGMKIAQANTLKADLQQIEEAQHKLETEDFQDLDNQTLEDLCKQMRRLNIEGHEKLVDILIERAESEPSTGKDRVAQLLTLLEVGDTARIERVKGLLGVQKDVAAPKDDKLDTNLGKDSAGYSTSDGSGMAETSTGDMLPTDLKPAAPMAAFTSFYNLDMVKDGTAHKKAASLESVIQNPTNKNNRRTAAKENTKEIPMNFAELKERSLRRRTAYHQGTEEAKKYPPMGDADKIRDTQDKQMTGDELDTSADNPDAKVKEMVQRASLEERRAARAALVEKAKTANTEVKTYKVDGKEVKTVKAPDGTEKVLTQAAEDGKDEKPAKKAYHQGTEKPQKYAPMGDSDKIRNNDDKQMSGQGMESGADGMHPGYGKSDEAVKKHWQRMASASLTAKRSLGSSVNEAKWDVFADGKRVLTVTAGHVYAGNLDKKITEAPVDMTYGEYFKSEAYGKGLLGLVRKAGPEGAAAELALPAGDAPAAAPAAEGDMGAARDKVLEALSAIEDAVEDVRSTLGVDGIKDVSVDALPEADAGSAAPTAEASDSNDLIKVVAAMNDAAVELTTLQTELDNGNADAMSVVTEALADVDSLVAHARAELEVFAAKKKDKKDEKPAKKDEKAADKAKAMKAKDKDADKAKAKKDEKEDKKPLKKKKSDAEILEEVLQARAARREALVATALDESADAPEATADDVLDELLAELEAPAAEAAPEQDSYDMAVSDGEMCADDGQAALDKKEKEEAKDIAEKEVDKHEDDMHEKKAARKAWREAVAAKATADLNKTYSAARPGNGAEVKVDAKVSGDLAVVENLHTQQAKDLEVAQSQPRNVRMAAEALNGLITKGAIASADLDQLVASGAVDPEAAKYWKQYFGQAPDGGKEFGASLVKDFKQSKASVDDMEVREIRLKRAYALGLEAQDKGIISKSRADLEKYVDSMARLPDETFEHMKNVVAQHKPAKVATAAPQVGLNYDKDETVEPTRVASASPTFDELASLFG